MAQLASIRRYLWIVPVILGLVFIGAGAYTMSEGLSAKDEVRSALVAEQITTSEDATIPGVLVDDVATARAQEEVIKEHTLESTEGKTYAQMDREDPQRDLYMKSVTLRTALNTAVMGFKVSDLVIGIGLMVVLMGATNVFMLAPVLYWTREPTPTGERAAAAKHAAPAAREPAPSSS